MPQARPLTRVVLLTVVLASAWLLWSGLYKPLLLGLGALSVALVLWLTARMHLLRAEIWSFHLGLRLPGFLLWLLKEVAVSSCKVARIVLTPGLAVQPTVVRIRALPRDTVGQATLGNSITLTPGTITLDIADGEILVHCLTRADALSLREGAMNRRVAELTNPRSATAGPG